MSHEFFLGLVLRRDGFYFLSIALGVRQFLCRTQRQMTTNEPERLQDSNRAQKQSKQDQSRERCNQSIEQTQQQRNKHIARREAEKRSMSEPSKQRNSERNPRTEPTATERNVQGEEEEG